MQICWDLEIKEQKKKIAIYKHFTKIFSPKPSTRTKRCKIYSQEEIEKYKKEIKKCA